MNDEQERRRPGRPRMDKQSSSVSTWVPAQQHDALIKIAHQHNVSVSAVVRQIILKSIRVD